MASADPPHQPPTINYVAGFLLVGLAWGLTNPFIRHAARNHKPPHHPTLDREDVASSWLWSRLYGAWFAAADLLRNPRYAVPLLLNLTGSVWFFLLIGKAGELLHCSQMRRGRLTSRTRRAEPDGAHRQHAGFPLYRSR